ncbi:putative DNA modification/repair radical SAM protein [Fusibacter sp. JL298sf-3]
METLDKLKILADAAKYDVSCSSSGSSRMAKKGALGNTALPGICHSWADDGRCVSLFKILMTNQCIYDCAYCQNRASNNDIQRAAFTVDEIVALTIQFYRRNYIEGLFLSSGIIKDANHTMSLLLQVVKRLRERENFNGYIHLKGIPGADRGLIEQAGRYVDRLSINIELPTSKSIRLLAPEKKRQDMVAPMQFIKEKSQLAALERKRYKNAPMFVPAGQTTQLIVGASREADYHIIKIAEAFYQRVDLKRVYYSAYMPVGNLPAVVEDTALSLRREHRIYQADWLMRFYGFKADEILNAQRPNLDMEIDPKCQWALANMQYFPIEVMRAPLHVLLRVPGIGNISARRIIGARKFGRLSEEALKKLGVVMKRAQYFITIGGCSVNTLDMNPFTLKPLLTDGVKPQLSMFEKYPTLFS